VTKHINALHVVVLLYYWSFYN